MVEPWRPGDAWRELDPNEVALLEALTALNFEGAAELRAQIPFALAQQGCGCGCGTIDLKVDETRAPAAELAQERPVLGEADVRSAGGEWAGGLLLFADGGYLRCLEVYTWLDEPMQLPQVSDIRTRLAEGRTPPTP